MSIAMYTYNCNYLQTLTATSHLPRRRFRSPLLSSSPDPNSSSSLPRSLSCSSISALPKLSSSSSNAPSHSHSNPVLASPCFPQTDSQSEGPMDSLVQVAHSVADAAGHVLRKYFRQRFDIIHKADLSTSFFLLLFFFFFSS